MASVTNPKRPAVAPQTDDQYNQFIERRLRQTSDHVKLVDLFGGLMLLMGGLLASLLCLSLIDAWVFELNRPLRLLALVAIVGTFAGYFLYQILPLLLRKINPAYSAQMIEQGHPELKNSLLNHVFFRRSPKSAPPVVERAVHRKAAEDLSHISIETAVDRSFLIHAAYFFVGVIALFGIYKIFSPKDPFQTIARVATPFADISRPAIVKISEIDPGDAEVFFGDALVVSARLRGQRDTQPVHLVYSTDDGQATERNLLMQAGEQERYAIELKTTDSGIQHDLHYWIVAGDAISPQYQVKVKTRPSITVESVSISPPSYTELEAYTQTQGNVASVEGAKITLQTRANLPISSASIQLLAQRSVAAPTATESDAPTKSDATKSDDDRTQAAFELVSVSSITMKVEDDNLAVGTFYLQMLTDRSAPRFTHYRVSFYTPDGATNENATIYRILTTPDLKPEIELLRPTETVHQLPENRSLRLEVHALDPDYELSDIRLVADSHGVQFFDRSIVKANTQLGSRGEVTLDFQPDAFGLRAGNEVMVYAAALDNRHAPISDALDPNVTKTRQIRIQVKPRLIDPERNDPTDANDKTDDQTDAQPDPQNDAAQDQQPRDRQEKDNPQDDPQQNDPKQQDQSKQNSQQKDPENKAGQPPKKEEPDQNKQNSSDQKSSDPNSSDQDSSESKTDSQNEKGKPKQGNESKDGDKSDPNKTQSGNSGQQSSSSNPQQDQSGDANSKQNSESSQNNASPQGNNNKSNSPNSTGEKSDNDAQPGDPANDSQPNDPADKQNGSQSNDSSVDPQQSSQENSDAQAESDPADAPVDHPGEAIKRIKQHAEKQQQAEKDRAQDQDPASQSDDNQSQSDDTANQSDSANQQSKSDGSDANPDKQQNKTEQSGVNPDSSEANEKKGIDPSKKEDAANQKTDAQSGNQQKDPANPDKSDANDSKNSDASQTDPKKGNPQADDTQSEPDTANKSDDAQQKSSDSNDPANHADPQQSENDSDKGADGSQNANDKESQQKPNGNGSQQKSDQQNTDQQKTDPVGKGNDPQDKQDKSANEEPAGNATDNKSDKSKDPTSEKGGDKSEKSQDADNKSLSANEGNKSQDADPADTKSDSQTKSDATDSKSQAEDKSNKQDKKSGNTKSSSDDQGNKKGNDNQGDQSSKSGNADSQGDIVGKGNQQGTPDGEPVDDRSPADDPNLEYSREATDLVLDYLKDQEKRNDKELLDELNWSEAEMQQFYEKWQQMRDRAEQGSAEDRQQFEEALRSLGLAPGTAQVERQQIRKQQIDGLQEKGTRSKPPAHLLEEFRSFNKSRSRADR